MCCKGFVKRVLPFFLTFAVGLFIASFFVTIAAPTFQFKNRSWRKNHRQYDRQIESENRRLRDENFQLKKELAEKDRKNVLSGLEFSEAPLETPRTAPFRDR